MRAWRADDVLAWQRVVAREWVALRCVAPATAGRLQVSEEYRCFCWRGVCVGVGRYFSGEFYGLDAAGEAVVRALAEEAAGRLGVVFVVVDIACTADGRWIVIEVNDGQDSGYSGVDRRAVWHRIVEAERGKTRDASC